jgi:hypothetical protein
VYVALCRFADNNTRQCYPSTRTLAALLHLGRPTVHKALRTLEDAGLIAIERGRTPQGDYRANVYTLLPLVGNDMAHRGHSGLPPVVNDVDHRGQGGLPELNSINQTQQNKGERALPRRTPTPAHATAVSGRDPNLGHPAVQAYRGVCKLTADETQRAAIAGTVTDVTQWEEVMRRWLLAGYRKTNVQGMLDWYRNGIPERNGGSGRDASSGRLGFQGERRGERRGQCAADTPEDMARRDAEWQKLVQESETRG